MARAKAVEDPPVPPDPIPGDPLSWTLEQVLERIGYSRDEAIAVLRRWAANNPNVAPTIEQLIAMVGPSLSPAHLAEFAAIVASGMWELVRTGRGEVQHSASEVA